MFIKNTQGYVQGVSGSTLIIYSGATLPSTAGLRMDSGHTYKLTALYTYLECDIFLHTTTEKISLMSIYHNSYYSQTKIKEFVGYDDFEYISIKIPTTTNIQFHKLYDFGIKEIKNLDEIVPQSAIVSTTGITEYGVPMITQNLRWDKNKIVYKDMVDYELNLQDTILFEMYYKMRKNGDKLMNHISKNLIYYDFYTEKEGYVEKFTQEEKNMFKLWNDKIKTSTINFEREAGIQLKSIDIDPDRSHYHDNFKGGDFYNGNFYGVWSGGTWSGGHFNGWNDTIPESVESLKSLTKTKKISPFHKDINYLKQQKKYYEIPPWIKK